MHTISKTFLRFIESLPGPANWTLWAKFIIIQTGNQKTFAQQCLDNTSNVAQLRRQGHGANRSDNSSGDSQTDTPLTHALNWERLARRHYRIVTCLYLYLLIKYRLLGFISDKYGYLDCVILGRFRFIGRTNRISGEIVSIFLICFFLYRLTIHLCSPNFKFFALEFLISSQEDILRIEFKRRQSEQNYEIVGEKRGAVSSIGGGGGGDERQSMERFYRVKPRTMPTPSRQASAYSVVVNSIVYLRDPFDLQNDKWILRPNRTKECWLTLALWTKFMIYYAAHVLVIWVFLMYLLIGGSIFTNLGFEMSYPACVSWLRNIQSAPIGTSVGSSYRSNNYSHIYLASPVLAHEICIDDVPARIPLDTRDLQKATFYTNLRASADILENLVIYGEFIILFMTQFYLLAINSIDVILNAGAIKMRLLKLLDKLETRLVQRYQEEARAECYSSFIEGAQSEYARIDPNSRGRPSIESKINQPVFKRNSSALTPYWTSDHAHQFLTIESQNSTRAFNDKQLLGEIVEMQAILADHFYTITQGYNLYVTFILSLMGLCWLLYTATLCIWMNSIRSRAIELEFVVAEANVTLFCLALTIGAALVRSYNLQLYNLITRAMALDPDWSLTKPRWTSILKYYYPKPFHCFTVFGSTEISVLLGLKIISWILSAFIVLANFFYANHFS